MNNCGGPQKEAVPDHRDRHRDAYFSVVRGRSKMTLVSDVLLPLLEDSELLGA